MNRELGLYQREIFCFLNVLNNMEKLMKSRQDHLGIMWPRLIGYSNNDIALEDLKAEGYKPLLRSELMNLEMSLLLIEKMARFHALGLALLENGSVKATDCFDAYYTYAEITRNVVIKRVFDLGEVISTSWGPEWREVGEKIIILATNGTEILYKQNQAKASAFNVINHGDCRTSNIMVKHDPLGNIVDMKFLDFQLINYSSFGYDFHFFTFLSIVPDVRRKHFAKLLETYYQSLIGTLSIYDYNIAKVPSLPELMKELRRMSFMPLVLIPLVGGFVSDAPNSLSDYRDEGEVSGEPKKLLINPNVFESEKFRDWFALDIKTAVENYDANSN